MYQKSKSHDQNDGIRNSLNLSENICEGQVERISDSFWVNCKHFTLRLFIGPCVTLVYAKIKIFWKLIDHYQHQRESFFLTIFTAKPAKKI